MKHVRGIIRLEALPRVIQTLKESNVTRLYVSRTRAMGAGVDPEDYRVSADEGETYTEKAVVEFLCAAERVGELRDVIRQAAQTGHRGDGVIIISDVFDVVSVRTGEHDRVALL